MLFLRRTPDVSMARNVWPSRPQRTSTLSRVAPGTTLTPMRSPNGRLDLLLNFVSEVVHVLDADAPGISQLHQALVQRQQRGNAVARHPRGRVHDGDAPARQPVEQRRLAHVGTAHDGDDRY